MSRLAIGEVVHPFGLARCAECDHGQYAYESCSGHSHRRLENRRTRRLAIIGCLLTGAALACLVLSLLAPDA